MGLADTLTTFIKRDLSINTSYWSKNQHLKMNSALLAIDQERPLGRSIAIILWNQMDRPKRENEA